MDHSLLRAHTTVLESQHAENSHFYMKSMTVSSVVLNISLWRLSLTWERKGPAWLAMQSQKLAAHPGSAGVLVSNDQIDHKIKPDVANFDVDCSFQRDKVLEPSEWRNKENCSYGLSDKLLQQNVKGLNIFHIFCFVREKAIRYFCKQHHYRWVYRSRSKSIIILCYIIQYIFGFSLRSR